MMSKNRLTSKLMVFVMILFLCITFPPKVLGQDIAESDDTQSVTQKIINISNSIASNSGTGKSASIVGEYANKIKNLAEGNAPDGIRLPRAALKQAIKEQGTITGPGQRAQMKEIQKTLGDTAKKCKMLERLGTAMSLVDPASKVFGAFYAEDYTGAALHALSGTCKYIATTGAGIIGTTAGGAVGPQGAVVGGIVAAGASGAVYDSYVQPLFDEVNQFNTYVNTMEKIVNKFMVEAYDTSTREALYAYMKGKISHKILRKIIRENKKVIDKQNAIYNRKSNAQRLELVAILRTVTDRPPEISKLIDLYEKDKLDNVGKTKLLAYLQHKHDAQCAQEESADNLISKIFKLNHVKLLATLQELNMAPSESYLNCLCRSAGYGSPQTRQFYHPGTLGKYDARYSCHHPGEPCIVAGYGCGRHPLPRDMTIIKNCMQNHLVGMEKDKDGKTLMKKGADGKVLKDKSGKPIPVGERMDILIYEKIKTISQHKSEEQRQQTRRRALKLERNTPFLTKPVE